jgi:alanine dehydrogenase
MIVGVPKEIKNNEYRVGMTPSGVNSFINNGHKVLGSKKCRTRQWI